MNLIKKRKRQTGRQGRQGIKNNKPYNIYLDEYAQIHAIFEKHGKLVDFKLVEKFECEDD